MYIGIYKATTYIQKVHKHWTYECTHGGWELKNMSGTAIHLCTCFIWNGVRVTRLGECLPNFRFCFLWAVFFLIFGGLLYSAEQYICNVHIYLFRKNGLNHILGNFFTNSSGHPGRRPIDVRTWLRWRPRQRRQRVNRRPVRRMTVT
jgi:hypothetical protein